MQKVNVSIDSMTDLINDLNKVYEETRSGNLNLQDAKTLSQVADKIIKASVVQMAYNKNFGQSEYIKFLK
jgi:hypothetical protein